MMETEDPEESAFTAFPIRGRRRSTCL